MTVQQQPPFLICVPFASGPDWPGVVVAKVEAELDRLNDPANTDVATALKNTKVIHFLSISVVWDPSSKDRPILVADVAGDGTTKTIIAALVKHAGALLLPVFQLAAGVKNERELKTKLECKRYKPVEASWPSWFHRTTGLAFQGTPALTVDRILKDKELAEKARTAVYALARTKPATALGCLGAARNAAGIVAKQQASPLPLSIAAPANEEDGVGSWAAKIAPVFVLDWSFLIIITFFSFFLNVRDLLGPLEGFPQSKPHNIIDSILLTILFAIVLDLSMKIIKFYAKESDSEKYKLPFTLISIAVIFSLAMFALNEPSVGLKPDPFSYFNLTAFLRPFALWIALVLGFLALVLFFAVVAGTLLGVLRKLEIDHKPVDADLEPKGLQELMEKENATPFVQNHMIGISQISGAFFRRRIFLPLAFYGVGLFVRAGIFKRGFLSDVGTIHFAQWAVLPDTSKLVFVADYDGSWQSYLEDFITLAPQGASAIWSNTDDFPKTSWLINGGAADGDRFKRWGRRQMIPTRFWYSAYPDLTATDIRNNADIRTGMEAESITASEAEAWLKLFGSAVRPVNEIEIDQIQGLALLPYRYLFEGVVLALSFPDSAKSCRDWLANVKGRISFGETGVSERAMAMALSASGLERLGSDPVEGLAAEFSPTFMLGMDDDSKSHVLGDVCANAPKEWKWGGPRNPEVHAVLLIYAKDPSIMEARIAEETKACTDAGLTVSHTINLHRWPQKGDPIREPFGFVDGISQPSIRGLISSRGALDTDLLEPGEFILGYQDGRKEFPSTPQVLAANDPEKLLPDLPPDFPTPPSAQAVRDLGRNGSYLVIRQLKQEKDKFDDYVNEVAGKLSNPPDPERVRAKMVGRWRNGAPIVLYPHGEPQEYNNFSKAEDFMFGRDDPQGLACPFGAHIRRANPRDQFDADSKTQMSITNRHRILRRGRSYVENANNTGADAQGLVFMCLNADIERQFEFLQQTWIGSKSFSGLRDEADPLTTLNRKKDGTFTIPTLNGPQQLTGMPSFVSVVGGGYFFMPGKQTLAYLSSYPTYLRSGAKSASSAAPIV